MFRPPVEQEGNCVSLEQHVKIKISELILSYAAFYSQYFWFLFVVHKYRRISTENGEHV